MINRIFNLCISLAWKNISESKTFSSKIGCFLFCIVWCKRKTGVRKRKQYRIVTKVYSISLFFYFFPAEDFHPPRNCEQWIGFDFQTIHNKIQFAFPFSYARWCQYSCPTGTNNTRTNQTAAIADVVNEHETQRERWKHIYIYISNLYMCLNVQLKTLNLDQVKAFSGMPARWVQNHCSELRTCTFSVMKSRNALNKLFFQFKCFWPWLFSPWRWTI